MGTAVDSFRTQGTLRVGADTYDVYRVTSLPGADRLPYSLKVLLENLLRNEDGRTVSADQVQAVLDWQPEAAHHPQIQFTPARVLLQDFTGVPCVVDLVGMRDAMLTFGGDPTLVNPHVPAELVIDHSVIVDAFGTPSAFARNAQLEFERNEERYQLLRWAQQSFDNVVVVPPDTGICHQVNLEYLARCVFTAPGRDRPLAYPDNLVGTDSHTPMINGLGVLGWGVGGIEAEAAMLGQPLSMLIPPVVGLKLTGRLQPGITATDLVLTVAQLLRRTGVVGKFVEFYGPGVANVPLADRATLGNMSPEYGSTCTIFPIDAVTLDYLRLTGRPPWRVALVEAYAKEQGMWHDPTHEPDFSQRLELDLATVEASVAGPARPQDRIALSNVQRDIETLLEQNRPQALATASVSIDGVTTNLADGDVVIAAITSCTNTSNPSVMVGAGLLAKNAVERGLQRKPWVKTSLAPGSRVVSDYYDRAGLTPYLDQLGFNLVGYGCTTCIGNSGPLIPEVSEAVAAHDLNVSAVLSGNRNFEGRIHPQTRMSFLASPPLVVAYALAGSMRIDLSREPLSHDPDGNPVYLRDIWPSEEEIAEVVHGSLAADMFARGYEDVLAGDENWNGMELPTGEMFTWRPESTYVQPPPFFEGMPRDPAPMTDIGPARVLAYLPDSLTTDHISPAGAIRRDSPAGRYLAEHGVAPRDFNSYGARRGNHEVMIRGTFANIRLRNLLVPGVEGGMTRHLPDGGQMSIFDAAQEYAREGVPLIILAGADYGSGSSRDWAAKGTMLLGVKAVLAVSFERIHRSNLIGMGVLPLQFPTGQTPQSLGLTGSETFSILGLAGQDRPPAEVTVQVNDGESVRTFTATVRIDTPVEADYYRHGGILPYVLRHLLDEPVTS